jgi:hypothetical protein
LRTLECESGGRNVASVWSWSMHAMCSEAMDGRR